MIGFPGDSDNKESACNAGDPGLIPGLGRSPLEKETVTHSSIVHGIAELDTTEGLHTFLCELSLSVTEEIRENWREVERQKTKEGYRRGDENRSEIRHPPPHLEALCQCESTSLLAVYSIYPASSRSPALVGSFFTASTTCEAQYRAYIQLNLLLYLQYFGVEFFICNRKTL